MYTITQSRLLYVLSINDRIHRGLLKIGEVFVDNKVADNPSQHAKTVREILNERPYMLGITYNLEYVEYDYDIDEKTFEIYSYCPVRFPFYSDIHILSGGTAC